MENFGEESQYFNPEWIIGTLAIVSIEENEKTPSNTYIGDSYHHHTYPTHPHTQFNLKEMSLPEVPKELKLSERKQLQDLLNS